jgi:cytochrome c5
VTAKAILTASLLLSAAAASFWAAASGSAQTAPQPAAAQPASRQQSAPSSDEGERIFEQNCSRCHNAPEGFSPRISGTIARHMRLRANLSEHDEQVLLHYLNP